MDDQAEIKRLAKLSPIAYDREREGAAELLGCRAATLDAAVKAERAGDDRAFGQGRPLDLPEPEPWPAPVDGAALLRQVMEAICRHVVIDDAPCVSVALWCLAVHAFQSFDIFPRLLLTAPTKGAGKSTLLDVIERLVPRPIVAASASAAALYRAIPAFRPVLLLDEADAWARDNEEVRAVLNAGHKRGAAVMRCVGDDNEPRAFDVFAPAVLAAIGRLPDTIEDRSVIVRLRRKLPGQAVEPLRGGLKELARLARRLARWARDHEVALSAAAPSMPAGIANRAADNWTPLLAVADKAGDQWPERARRAAVELVCGEDQTRGVMLLADVRRVLSNDGRVTSEALAARLAELEGRPWAEYRGGKPITKTQLGHLLSPFGIESKGLRQRDGRTPKGYERDSFADAWKRYLPEDLPSRNATPQQPNETEGLGTISKRHNGHAEGVRGVSELPKDQEKQPRGGVAFQAPPPLSDEDRRALFEERSAITEFDGGPPRVEAERLAALNTGEM